MKHVSVAAGRPARAVALGLAVVAWTACTKTAPEPAGPSADAATGATTTPGAGSSPARDRAPRDSNGRFIPKSVPPAAAPAAASPFSPGDSARSPGDSAREPDWDLDSNDAARDYVRRYAAGTTRYGNGPECIDVGASMPANDKGRVEVTTAASCPGAGTVRDVFLVDVAGDRLSVDDPSKRDPLARWPDGSDAEGPANPPRSVEDMRKWNGPLRDAFRDLQLAPIRFQAYGRGTYPVITIAAWHNQVAPKTAASDLRDVADRLCKANGNLPLAVFGGLDRSTILRIRCSPAAARWDKL